MVRAKEIGSESLVLIRWEIDELLASQSYEAIGTCVKIEDGDAVVMLSGMSMFAPPEDFKRLRATTSVDPTLELEGVEFLGVDRASGMAFVRVSGDHGLEAVEFVTDAPIEVGDEVASVGLLSKEMGLKPYVGTAYISASIRKPETNYIVSGGELTNLGSLVINDTGQIVGMVNQQPYAPFMGVADGRQITLGLRGMMWSQGFLPSAEFIDVLDRIPASADEIREMPWIGALSVEAVDPGFWEIYGMDSPGIKLNGVVPARVADNSGLKDGDIIVAVDGEAIEEMPTTTLTQQQFLREFNRRKVGDDVTFTILGADGGREDVIMTIAPFPVVPYQAETYLDRTVGMAIREKVEMDRLIDRTDAAEEDGVYVMMVARDSPAAVAGVQGGDLIVKVGGNKVSTIEGYKKDVAASMASVRQVVELLVWRGDEQLVLKIRMGQN